MMETGVTWLVVGEVARGGVAATVTGVEMCPVMSLASETGRGEEQSLLAVLSPTDRNGYKLCSKVLGFSRSQG